MNTNKLFIDKDSYKCKFSISLYLIKVGYNDIVERSILRAMKQLYVDGVLTLDPVDVRLITEAEADERQGEWPDSHINSAVIYFQDKERRQPLRG